MPLCNSRDTAPFRHARFRMPAMSGALLLLTLSASLHLPAQSQGMILAGSITGAPGDTVSLPLMVTLNPGVRIDTLGVTLVFTPSGAAPPLVSGKPTFSPAAGIPAPSFVSSDASDIVLAWLGSLTSGNSQHGISGTVVIGQISATIPAGALNGQAYTVQITRAEGDLSGTNGSLTSVPLASISSAIGPVSTARPLPPVIQPHGILNAASLSSKAVVSPGSIASLFGLNLAPAATDSSVPPALALLGTQLFLNGVPALLFYVSPNQINFQVPVEVPGTSAQATVVSNGVSSLSTTVQLAPESPGIFSLDASGTGRGAVLNQDFSLNSATNPATAGSAIMIFATGLGQTNPPFTTGQPGGISTPNVTVDTPTVLINGKPAQVLFSGLAPGFAGEYQINATIPAETLAGAAVSLQVTIGSLSSNTVAFAVRQQ